MDNITLDTLLKSLLNDYKDNKAEGEEFTQKHQAILEGKDWKAIREYLVGKNFIWILRNTATDWRINLTAEGKKFISDGGFSGDETYKDETLLVAKDSRKYAKWAFWVSIAGVLLTIILYLIDHFS
jgi:hypothetical protein